jgi:hypothetical protein
MRCSRAGRPAADRTFQSVPAVDYALSVPVLGGIMLLLPLFGPLVVMSRTLIWNDAAPHAGWACSSCDWNFPLPTLLADPEARSAYDRLAASKFRDHQCETKFHSRVESSTPEAADTGVAERARVLVMRGYKPKDAVELVLQEMALEYAGHSSIMERAKKESEQFLDKIRRGLI